MTTSQRGRLSPTKLLPCFYRNIDTLCPRFIKLSEVTEWDRFIQPEFWEIILKANRHGTIVVINDVKFVLFRNEWSDKVFAFPANSIKEIQAKITKVLNQLR